MTKIKAKILVLLACFAVALCCLALFSACGGSGGDYTVTFMIYDDDAEQWEQYGNPVSTNGSDSVTLPSNPSWEYYRFRGWYEDMEYSTPFENAGISSNMTVYARFSAIEVTVHYEDYSGTQTLEYVMEELTAEYEAQALDQGFTFGGWYTDAGYTTLYSGQDTDNLYARNMATVTYYNGYETLLEVLVGVGDVISAPDTDDIVQYYMDEEDVSFSYTGDDGWALADEETGGSVPFDFSRPITQNTTITVLWKTPHLVYDYDNSTGTYIVKGYDYNYRSEVPTYPVFSILSENVTIEQSDIDNYTYCVRSGVTPTTGSGQSVKAICGDRTNFQGLSSANWNSVIIANGIESILNFVPTIVTNRVTVTVFLPASVKVIENSFNDFVNLTSVDIQEGVEVIVNSFKGCGFTELLIPDSVINLSGASEYFIFSENSSFVNEGNGRIYLYNNGNKILIMDKNITDDGVLYIEEGVDGIQTGTFAEYEDSMTYLYLPSSFSFINYNANVSDYAGTNGAYYPNNIICGSSNSNGSGIKYLLYSGNTSDARSGMSYAAFTLISWLESDVFQAVVIDGYDLPDGVSEYAFSGSATVNYTTSLYPYTLDVFLNEDKVVFTATKTEGTINVVIHCYDATNDNDTRYEIASDDKNAVAVGEKITLQWLYQQTGLDQHPYFDRLEIVAVTDLGEAYEFDADGNAIEPVTRNLYITITYEYSAGGFYWEVDEETNTITVTGFNSSTAYDYSNDYMDGLYMIIIPAKINDIPVTTIAEGAFSGTTASRIGAVVIGENITTIGEEAFKDTLNMDKVIIKSRVLEYIGDSAFENSGFYSIALPLANLQYVGPFAFKSETLHHFETVEGEEERTGYNCLIENITDEAGTVIGTKLADWVTEGAYYLVYPFSYNTGSANANSYALAKYVGTEVIQMLDGLNSETTMDIQQHNIQLIAVAGAYEHTIGFSLGYSPRRGTLGQSINTQYDYTLCFEVMEGSVYYMSMRQINFVNVSYIHAGAFTDMNSWAQTVTVYTQTSDIYITLEQVQNQDPEIFENGWWDYLDNIDPALDFMKNATTSSYANVA